MNQFEESVISTHDKFRDAIQAALVVFGHYTAGNRAVAISRDLETKFLIIDRDELPTATIIQRDGKDHVEVDSSEAGTWPINSNPERNRRWGLEYLAAAEMIVKARAKQNAAEAKRDKRRDELAEKFAPGARWSRLSEVAQRAIDYAIELEDKK